ncbi:GNAT family N-acetyltransferase [Blastochloris tepida]|uniref:N-acetyltransferase n=1 Tax=Blastochloris tepida TaxID=2233851 RepID=A0A348G2D5_9HYPH|nr:N-acetyltransferase [Blastochloris tepida]BBF93718.1 N-acetyltransferase [Blastochloris tepida]
MNQFVANRLVAAQPVATGAAGFVIDSERPADEKARERLLDRAMGPERRRKTCERLRAGRLPADGLALVARDALGRIIGTVRLWHVQAAGVQALMLGPLAVDPWWQGHGVGGALMREALARASARGHGAVILVGDAPYYARFGFSPRLTAALDLPGPVDRARFLALELKPGALDGARGCLRASGAKAAFARVSRRPALTMPARRAS